MLKRAMNLQPDDIIVKDASLFKVKENGPSRNKLYDRGRYTMKGVDLRAKKIKQYTTDGLRIHNTIDMEFLSTNVKTAKNLETDDLFLVDYALWKDHEQMFNYAVCLNTKNKPKDQIEVEYALLHHFSYFPSCKLTFMNHALVAICEVSTIIDFLHRDVQLIYNSREGMKRKAEEWPDKEHFGPMNLAAIGVQHEA